MNEISFEDYIEASSNYTNVFDALKPTEIPNLIKKHNSLKERLTATFLSITPVYFIATKNGENPYTKDFVLVASLSYFLMDVGQAQGKNFLLSPREYIGTAPYTDALKKLREKIKKTMGEKEKQMYLPMLTNEGVRYSFLFVAFLGIASPREAFEFANTYINNKVKTNAIIAAFFNE